MSSGYRVGPDTKSEALTVVREYGRVRTRRPLVLNGLQFTGGYGDRPSTLALSVPAGAVIQTTWVGSDYAPFVYDGVEYAGNVPAEPESWLESDLQDFEYLSSPVTETWVKLRPLASAPAAWLRIDQPGLEVENVECYVE